MSNVNTFELIVELLVLSTICIVVLVFLVKCIKKLNKWRNSKKIVAVSQLQEKPDIYIQQNLRDEHSILEKYEEEENNTMIRLDQNLNRTNEFSSNSLNNINYIYPVDNRHPFGEERKEDRSNYPMDIEMGGLQAPNENGSLNRNNEPEDSKKSVKDCKEFKDEILSKIDKETVVVEEANFKASLTIALMLFTITVIFENTEFCVHKENGFECCMQSSHHRQAAQEQNESNNEESKSSGNSQPYSYYSASKSKESGSKPPSKRSKKKGNSNPGEEPSDSSDSDDKKSNHTQHSDYSERYEEDKDNSEMEYVKINKKEFKEEKEFKIFAQNTVNHSIIRYNKWTKILYLNCLKTEEKQLENYIKRDDFINLCLENVEIELDSLKDSQHKIVNSYLEDCDIQSQNNIIFNSSNQEINKKINEEIRLYLNAKNLYLFKSVISQMKGYHLELRNFEFYDISEFADFISMTKNYFILTFKNCKIHTNENLLFKENKKYPNQNISLRNCSYYLKSNNKVKKSCFDESGYCVQNSNKNRAKILKKALYLRKNSLANDSIPLIPDKLISSKQYYFDATHKKRTRSCNCSHQTRSTLSSSRNLSVSLE